MTFIVDCSFDKDQLLINIQVPLTKNINWRVYYLVSVPFSWNNEICSIIHDKMLLAQAGEDVKIISGSALDSCKVENSLCFIPRYVSDINFGSSCPYMLFRGCYCGRTK
jgi:hypothetical protein